MNKADRDYILEELENLNATFNIVIKASKKTELDELQSAGLGACLTDMYRGCENIFRTFAEDKDKTTSFKGEHWHSKLFKFAKAENLIPEGMEETIEGMMYFRHVQVHNYGFKLDEKRMLNDSVDLLNKFPAFEKHIRDILEKE